MYEQRKVNAALIVGGLICFVLAAVLLHSFKGRFGQDTASTKMETVVMEDTVNVASSNADGGESKQVLPVGSSSASSQWVVYLTGAVKKPGVYSIPSGARIFQALQSAGGFAADADQEAINLAAAAADGAHIHFPRKGESAAVQQQAGQSGSAALGAGASASGKAHDGSININSASASELEAISGVGPKTAQAIVAYREANGPFARAEDVMLVKGIGAKKFEAMKGQISVGK